MSVTLSLNMIYKYSFHNDYVNWSNWESRNWKIKDKHLTRNSLKEMFALKPIKYVDIEEFVMCLMILLHSRLRLHFSESCEKLVFVCHAEVTGFFFSFSLVQLLKQNLKQKWKQSGFTISS